MNENVSEQLRNYLPMSFCLDESSNMFDSIKAHEMKLEIFKKDLDRGKLNYFPLLRKHLENSAAFMDNAGTSKEIHQPYFDINRKSREMFSESSGRQMLEIRGH